jgi:hypothetical protein
MLRLEQFDLQRERPGLRDRGHVQRSFGEMYVLLRLTRGPLRMSRSGVQALVAVTAVSFWLRRIKH